MCVYVAHAHVATDMLPAVIENANFKEEVSKSSTSRAQTTKIPYLGSSDSSISSSSSSAAAAAQAFGVEPPLWFPAEILRLFHTYRTIDRLWSMMRKRNLPPTVHSMESFDLFDQKTFRILNQICTGTISIASEAGSEQPEIILTPGGASDARATLRARAVILSLTGFVKKQLFEHLAKVNFSAGKKNSRAQTQSCEAEAWQDVLSTNILPVGFLISIEIPTQHDLIVGNFLQSSGALNVNVMNSISKVFVTDTKNTKARGLHDLLTPKLLDLQELLPNHRNESTSGASRLLDLVELLPLYKDQLIHRNTIKGRASSYLQLAPPELPETLHAAVLANNGINIHTGLFRHQTLGINALRSGHHLSLATETSSGKSLVYNICVAEECLKDRNSTHLYLFPTKALAQDQLRTIQKMCGMSRNETAHLRILAGIFDGDSSEDQRISVAAGSTRGGPQILLTNPDMLHYTMLPNHKEFQRFFGGLKFIIIDEAHHYKGAFGAHVSCVLRRLFRICSIYNEREPQIVICSATIPNPRDLFNQLMPFCNNDRLVVVDADQTGTALGDRLFALWNPSLVSSASPSNNGQKVAHSKKKLPKNSLRLNDLVTDTQYYDNGKGKDVPNVASQRFDEENYHLSEYDDDKAMQNFLRSCEDRSRIPATWRRLHGNKPRRGEHSSSLHENKILQTSESALSSETNAGNMSRALQPSAMELTATRIIECKRESSVVDISRLLAFCVFMRIRTLCFCGTRKLVERVNCMTQHELRWTYNAENMLPFVASYRGGYTIEERRRIETGLFDGSLLAVVATCALELGVDVGSLDVTLHLGFPGSFSSLWQQAGRAGRGGRSSLSILVCWQSSPVDQYFARNPLNLFDSKVEDVFVGSGNPYIIRGHLLCAAFEVPLEHHTLKKWNEKLLWGAMYEELVEDLISIGHLSQIRRTGAMQSGYRFVSAVQGDCLIYEKPSKVINLRLTDPLNINICDETRDMIIIDSMPYSRAFFEAFEGSVFYQQARQYLITKLILGEHRALCRPVQVGYFTSSQSETSITILKQLSGHNGIVGFGRISVKKTASSYVKRSITTRKIIDKGKCVLPPLKLETDAVWINISIQIRQCVELQGYNLWSTLHAVNHVLVSVASVLSLCDIGDLDCEHFGSELSGNQQCRLLLYDRTPGGIGICEKFAASGANTISAAKDILVTCSCEQGCPECLFDLRCSEYNGNLSKSGAVVLLTMLYSEMTQSSTATLTPSEHIPQSELACVENEQGYDSNDGGFVRCPEFEPSPRQMKRTKLQHQSRYSDARSSRGMFLGYL